MLDKTYVFSYNEIGNIVSVSSYPYTTGDLGTATATVSYTYDTAATDRLTSFNGKSITYDSLGCPLSYDGKTFTWSNGRLHTVRSGNLLSGMTTYTFVHNAKGQRVGKNMSFTEGRSTLLDCLMQRSIEYTYDLSGRLIAEDIAETYKSSCSIFRKIVYLYDESSIVGFVYTKGETTNVYYYDRNIYGDVVAIYDVYGTKIVSYNYDSFGNCTMSGVTNTDVANINPIRYRGYYFDQETGLYYLGARYYNPEWRRFISPDSIEYLDPESINGLNLYAYCFNDPINYADPSGCFPVLAVILCGIALVGMGLTIGGVASDNNTLTAVGLGMVGVAALVSGSIALAGTIATGATLTGIIGAVTATAGLGSLGFMSAEIQEATGNGNWIMDTTGMSDGLYNTLLLSTAAIATLGTAASSVSSAFNIKSINGFGKYGDYYGMKFQTWSGKTRVLSFHNHGHKIAKGIKSIREWHWQLQKWNPMGNKTSGTIARWIWWSLTRM